MLKLLFTFTGFSEMAAPSIPVSDIDASFVPVNSFHEGVPFPGQESRLEQLESYLRTLSAQVIEI